MKPKDLDREIANCISEAARAHSRCPFIREEELKWFLSYLICRRIETNVEREARSQLTYVTDDDGKLVPATDPVPGRRRSYGRIDIEIPRVPEETFHGAAIEVKFPRGPNQDDYLPGNLRRDLQKLSDEDPQTRKFFVGFIEHKHKAAFMTGIRRCLEANLTLGISWCGLFFDDDLYVDSIEAEPPSFLETLRILIKSQGVLSSSECPESQGSIGL